MQNIDKISMGVAGVILLLGFTFPFFVEDEGKRAAEKIRDAVDVIEDTDAKQNERSVKDPPLPRPQDEVAAKFRVGTLDEFPEWAFYRRPAYVIVKEEIKKQIPVHEAATITNLRVEPDAELQRFVCRLEAVPGDVQNVKVDYMIEAREGDSEEWRPLGVNDNGVDRWDLSETITISSLEADRRWAFRIRSEALSQVDQKLPREEREKYSNETDAMYIPKVENWFVTGIIEGQVVGGKYIDGSCHITREYWDFDASKPESEREKFKEPENPVKATKLFDTDWEFVRIAPTDDPDTGKKRILLRNRTLDLDRRKMYLVEGIRLIEWKPAPWEAPAASAEGEEAPEEMTEEKPKPKKEKPKKRGLFGNN